MLFKRLNGRSWFLLLLAFSLVGCDDNDNGQTTQATISTVEELNSFVSGINFVINLSDGETVSFTLGQFAKNISQTNFSDEGAGFDFTELNKEDFEIEHGNGKASISIGFEIINFDVVICTSTNELEDKYPYIVFAPNLSDYLIFFAFDIDKGYNELDVIGGSISEEVTVMTLLVDPHANRNSLFFGDINIPGDLYIELTGNQIFRNGTLSSDGTASIYDSYFGQIFSDNYSLELTCN